MLRLLLLVSVFVKNIRSRLSRLLSGRRLVLGETRRSLSAAHVSLLQHKIKTQPVSLSKYQLRGLSEKLKLPRNEITLYRTKKKHSAKG